MIIISILIFGVLIFIHELGHYVVAKLCKIKVNEFSIGMGPKLFGWRKSETLYSIRAIPMGGFVKMEGEGEESSDSGAFYNKSAWKKLLVSIAGSFMNISLGFIIIFSIVCYMPKICNMTIVDFDKNSTSNSTGLEIGDKILEIGDYKLKTTSDVNYIMLRLPKNGKTDVLVKRNGEILKINDVQFPVVDDKENDIKYVYMDFNLGLEDKNFLTNIKHSFNMVVADVKSVYFGIESLITGKFGIKSFSGPVQITQIIGQAASQSFLSLLRFVALITVNLGVLNLLPFPALDGCRAIFSLIEMIIRKPINPKYEGYIHLVGFVALMFLGLIITYNDVMKLIAR